MKTRSTNPAPIVRGSIRADEVLLFSEAAKRLGLCQKTRRSAIRAGLRVIRFGRSQYVLGSDALDFFRQLAERQGVSGDE